MDALDILKSARAKITSPEDWGKGRRRIDRPMETCCAAEAVEDSDPDAIDGWKERRRAFRALNNAADVGGASELVAWNDAPERTHAEVLAAFDLAIATLRM